MSLQPAALLVALALVPACAERLKIPDERPDISSLPRHRRSRQRTPLEGGVGDGGAVIASRRLLQGGPSKVQHSSEAMLAAMT